MDRLLDRPLRVRSVPSVAPSGSVSLGSARLALFNWLLARRSGGTLVVRLAADEPDAAQTIARDLRWIGLTWDEGPEATAPASVAQRRSGYGELVERLVAAGAAYARDGALWFRTPPGRIVVEDAIKGTIAFEQGAVADFILRAEDGAASAVLAAAIDDAADAIDLVLLADEHLEDTARQMLVLRALGYEPPRYAHAGTLVARRDGSPRETLPDVDELRREGYLPQALIEQLALLGWSDPDARESGDLEELARRFSVERMHGSPCVFDVARLRAFNARALRALPRERLHAMLAERMQAERLLEDPVPDAARRWIETFLDAYASEVHTLGEALDAVRALRSEAVTVPALELERLRNRHVLFFLDAVSQYVDDQPELRDLPLAHDLAEIAREFGLASADALGAVRMALTGTHDGPPLALLFPLLGHDRIMIRIGAVSSHILHGRGLQPIAYGPGGVPFETIQPAPPPAQATGPRTGGS